MVLYELIAKLESEDKDTTPICKLINFHKNCLKEFFRSIDNNTYLKIKLCLAHYNNKYLTDEAKPNINASWYLAILSNNQNAKLVLSYDKIFHYIDEEREPEKSDEEEIESKDLVVTSFNSEGEEQTPEEYPAKFCYIDDLEYFFANYILYLNNFINQLEENEAKRLLLQKKYLLLSIGDLDDTEEDFLINGTLNHLPLPPYIKELLNPKSFNFLINNLKEILANIRISDLNITSNILCNIIINLLLLKTYLELSINEEVKNEVITEISHPDYYKKPNYSILSNYIDDIIFSSPNINRKRKQKN